MDGSDTAAPVEIRRDSAGERRDGSVSPPPPPQPPATRDDLPPDVEVETQMTVRRARAAGGLVSLPVAASTQEYAAALAPHGDAALDEEVPTGSLPPPIDRKKKKRKGVVAAAPRPGAARTWADVLCHCCRRAQPPGAPTPEAAAAAPPVAESREYSADEHRLTLKQLGERYRTHIDAAAPTRSKGLTAEEAAARLSLYGGNHLSPPYQTPEIIKFLKQVGGGGD